jgi:hypothetical protein
MIMDTIPSLTPQQLRNDIRLRPFVSPPSSGIPFPINISDRAPVTEQRSIISPRSLADLI